MTVERTFHQIGLGLGDAWRSRGRVLLLWLQLALGVVGLLLGWAMWSEARQFRDQTEALEQWRAVRFDVITAGELTMPRSPGPALDAYLRQALDGQEPAWSVVVYGYPARAGLGHPVVVVLGALPQDWPGAAAPLKPGLWIGAQVEGFPTGTTVDLGPHQAAVVGRLPAGWRLINEHGQYYNPILADRSLVWVTTYADYFDDTTAGPELTLDGLLFNLVLLDPPPDQVTQLQRLLAQDQDRRLIPVPVVSDAAHQGSIQGARSSLVIALCLIGLTGLGAGAVLSNLVRRTLQDQGVNRLLGATMGESRLRLHAFVALVQTGPVGLALLVWWRLPFSPLSLPGPVLLAAGLVALVAHLAAVEVAARVIRRDSLSLATRGTD
ncbi:MAG: hypothetical protein LBL55_12025 [Propionibacteriaceae bacterium]|jgi:hypothetical protein|nr:hypothetical protein [Propionibacteriaceae bacterium]